MEMPNRGFGVFGEQRWPRPTVAAPRLQNTAIPATGPKAGLSLFMAANPHLTPSQAQEFYEVMRSSSVA
jgi:hypothetical protein